MSQDHSGELEKGFLIKTDMIDIAKCYASGLDTVVDGPQREFGRVLYPVEPLLLDGGDEGAVLDQTGGGIVVMAGDPQDIHMN